MSAEVSNAAINRKNTQQRCICGHLHSFLSISLKSIQCIETFWVLLRAHSSVATKVNLISEMVKEKKIKAPVQAAKKSAPVKRTAATQKGENAAGKKSVSVVAKKAAPKKAGKKAVASQKVKADAKVAERHESTSDTSRAEYPAPAEYVADILLQILQNPDILLNIQINPNI
jgi:hypothetical protein